MTKPDIRFTIETSTPWPDLAEIVRAQLPRVVYEKFMIELVSDPFHLRTLARFKANGQVHECVLEEEVIDGRRMALKIPEDFIAHLCVVG